MRELKSIDMIVNDDYKTKVYLKSEADKVIADKDAKILALEAEVFKQKHRANLFFEERNYAETQLRYQKYKRCLAMSQEWRSYATFCGIQSSWHNHRGFGKTAEKYTWKECHAWKCVYRYKELAKKFKEVK